MQVQTTILESVATKRKDLDLDFRVLLWMSAYHASMTANKSLHLNPDRFLLLSDRIDICTCVHVTSFFSPSPLRSIRGSRESFFKLLICLALPCCLFLYLSVPRSESFTGDPSTRSAPQPVPMSTSYSLVDNGRRHVPYEQWSHGICNCCAPSGGVVGCCYALFCPSCAFGEINGMLTPGRDMTPYVG